MKKENQEFREKSVSIISHHGEDCCADAWSWFQAMDTSFINSASVEPPAWLRTEFDWGPSTWPIYWCDLLTAESIDCGVFAALARSLLAARGVSVVPVQLTQKYNEPNVMNWRDRWESEANPDWLVDDIAYHETIGILEGANLRVWDPVDTEFVDPPNTGGYGEVVAIRVVEAPATDDYSYVDWQGLEIQIGSWQQIPRTELAKNQHPPQSKRGNS